MKLVKGWVQVDNTASLAIEHLYVGKGGREEG